MLNTATYPSAHQADAATAVNEAGRIATISGSITGNASSSAQLITCQPPRCRARRPPSA
ncbi:hypothetical protein D3C80_2174650 [compost metagenome]